MDTDSAWREVIVKWFAADRANKLLFTESVQQTLKMGSMMGCGTMGQGDNCHGPTQCGKGLDGEYSGPAAEFIWMSLIQIHKMYHEYWDALGLMAGMFALGADDMEDTFAPIPEPKTNQWLNVLIDLITIGTLTTAAPFFNGILKQLPSFANPVKYDNAKDTTLNIIGQSTTLAKDLLKSPEQKPWTPQEQNKFSTYIGQVIFGWMNVTDRALEKLFDGTHRGPSDTHSTKG